MKLTDPIFSDEAKARAHFERIRWPEGPFCPHCGEVDKVYRVEGKSARAGLIHCNSCSGQFTVTTGGVMESSHVPLTKWAMAFYLYSASKKGFSAHQLHRQIGVSYKTAWFMAHRIREAMAPAAGSEPPLGGRGKVVEADETYIGKTDGKRRKKAWGGMGHKMKVVSLVERGGNVRSKRVKDATKITVKDILKANVHPETILHTDGSQIYTETGLVKKHETVDHSISYVGIGQNGRKVHTNTLEGFFSIFKRGMVGTYQHCGEQHLDRYLAEFDFRMNNREAHGVNDTMRAERAIHGATGKRLTYQQTNRA
jgi:transposase-like protein